MLLRLLLSAQADKLSQKLRIDSGSEMKAAREAAESTGAQLVLGMRIASVCTVAKSFP